MPSAVPLQPLAVVLSQAFARGFELEVPKPEAITGAPLTEMDLEISQKHGGPWTKVEYDMAVRKKVIRDLEPGSVD